MLPRMIGHVLGEYQVCYGSTAPILQCPVQVRSYAQSSAIPDRVRLEVLGAAFHGLIPDGVRVRVENQSWVFRGGEPESLLAFGFELARTPTGIAEGNQALMRSVIGPDVAQDRAAYVSAIFRSIPIVCGL